MSVEFPQLARPLNHHYFYRLKPKSRTHCSTCTSSPVPSETTHLFTIIPFSSNLQRKCQTAPSSFQAARRPARMTCLPTTPLRRMSPSMTRGLLSIVIRGALRRRTRRRTTKTTMTLTLTRLLLSERGEHDPLCGRIIFRLSSL